MNKHCLPLLALCCCLLLGVDARAQVVVQQLLTENRVNPLGLEEKQPRFSWQLQSPRRNTLQHAYELKVFNSRKQEVWSSGKVTSGQSRWVPYGGPALQSGEKYFWQVRVWDNTGKASPWSAQAFWQTALFQQADWQAQWVQAGHVEDSLQRPSPYFRKTFATTKKVVSATAFITAQGLYEAFLNGQRVGDAYLTPGWTSYHHRLQYQQYDVTHLLATGNNAIGVRLGSGWYRGYIGFSGQKNFYGKELALLFQLNITYSDGTKETIASDGTWKSATGGIVHSEIYHGETIDARLEPTGWHTTSFNDSGWRAVKIKDNPTVNLIATYNEPIRKKETFPALKLIRTPRGEQVLDFGQNLVGWVQVKVRGNAGDRITLYHAEVLDKAGNFYTDNLRPARQQNVYILKGGGEETFEPHFTFQGFRYVKVEGYPGDIQPENFTAVALYSDMTPTGTFASASPLINQLQHNIQWGQRGNFLDVPTDCPQRDERLGWTGDAQAFARTATFNFDVHNFFAKWLKDVAADQVDGSVPFVVPNVLGARASGSAGWADAATIIPWTMYLAYGDTRVLADQYESMKAWVGYMERNSTQDLWNKGFHFGDWLFYRPFDDNDGRSAVTDKYLIAQCFFAHSTELLVKTARVLGKPEDVARYTELLTRVREAFMKEYVTPSGRLVSGTQTAYVLALHFDMLPEAMRLRAAQQLADNVRSYGNHLTTGFLGTPYLCHVLSRFGHTGLAYTLLLQETYPSWLYPVKMGATTIWERWDGIKPDSTFQTPSMNSFNHYAYGAIGDWMYRVATGIDTDEQAPGYQRITIRPHPDKRMGHARSAYHTPYGQVVSGWRYAGNQLVFEVAIPANTTAAVYLPAAAPGQLTEGGKALATVKEITVAGQEGDRLVLHIGSGTYRFEMATDWANFQQYATANQQLMAPTPNEPRVVFMGNSITEGWARSRPAFFEGRPYINRGISGQTTAQMVLRFQPDVIDLKPKVVVLLAGTNDIAGNTGYTTLDQIMANIQHMVQQAKAHQVRVVLCSVLPAYDYPWRPGLQPAGKIVALNQRIKQLAAEQGCVYVDYFSAMADQRNGLRAGLGEDGVHPNAAGYQIMEPLVERGIAEALK
ncbi:MAG: family 78 glycoside hydrolase catalytic domain [Bacteroidota bacterium]